MKKIFICILTVCAIASHTICFAQYSDESLEEIITETASHIYSETINPHVGSIGGEWAVFGLSRSGVNVDTNYFGRYYSAAKRYITECDGILSDRKYTEYSRLTLALTSIGIDASDIDGYDLTAPLLDFESTSAQGLNGAIWALIALDSADYGSGNGVRDKYVDYILSRRLKDGGWELSGGEISDPDITGMALTALSNYRNRSDVNTAIDKALEMLSERQNENGGYSSWGNESLESAAWVMIALNSLGVSIDDERFVKNQTTIPDRILSFYTGNGGFKHTLSDDTENQMAAEQALYSLCSLKRALNNENTLFDLSDHITFNEIPEADYFGLAGKSNAVAYLKIQHPAKTFNDVWAHENQEAMEALAQRGIIDGKTDELFYPDDTITRAEFAAVVTRALGLEAAGDDPFFDVSDNDWFFDSVRTAYFYGIVNGVSDDEFCPDRTITREEAAVMVTRAAVLCGMDTAVTADTVRDTLSAFVDYITVSDWAKEALAFCYKERISDDAEIEIQPHTPALRCEIAQMLFNMLGKAELL